MAASDPPVSPSSSQRLPSPPPIAEDQTGPQSPISATSDDHGRLGVPLLNEQVAERRIRPGTKAADMAEGPPVVPFADIDSAFQLNEHLKALHFSYTHPALEYTTVPIDRPTATTLSEPPEGIDRALWLYELCRFLVQKVNAVIVAFFADHPPCSAQTCPEMRASEWQYLCAVHDPPKPCCAIDYCCHTLDWAANTLTSPKHFPSRLSLGGESHSQHQVRQLTNIFRRVYRIFAHAWFQHREMFWRVEGKTGLYTFFKTVCDIYELIPADNYTIPLEAEGKEPLEDEETAYADQAPSILKKPSSDAPVAEVTEDTDNTASGALPTATARRHRPSPSTGATPVNTVIEETEEETDDDEKIHESSIAKGAEESSTVNSSLLAEEDPNLSEISLTISADDAKLVGGTDKDTQQDPTALGEITPSAIETGNKKSYFSDVMGNSAESDDNVTTVIEEAAAPDMQAVYAKATISSVED